ncbi:MAG: DUF1156 domain-containing protein [Fimbriimonadaceae bacterium]|nr:DUF1156 domain-containing protein [Fimbriimonadaceae bacterium]
MNQPRKKLIEVALPLEEVNIASAREKSIRHGHPSTLHLWWARRPLAACRAVIFAQIVDDPGEEGAPKDYLKRIDELPLHAKYRHLVDEPIVGADGKPLEGDGAKEQKLARERRYRLFTLIEQLVQWENTTNEAVLEPARELIRLSCGGDPPPLHDPFAGGGSIPLEAQRLGLEAYASDLNPVAVLINKAMIEIPPKFAGRPPVNPEARRTAAMGKPWKGAQGLADDVRYYGQWMRDEAEKRIGHLYPKIKVTAEMVAERPDLQPYLGRELTVIAWLWARTVKSPNPAFAHVDVPLVSSFLLSTKANKEAYVEPVIEGDGYRFMVRIGRPRDVEAAKLGTTAGKRAAFTCLMSSTPVSYDHIRSEGQEGRMGARLMAIVAEGDRGRVYLSPSADQESLARTAQPGWSPDIALPTNPRDFKTPNYGLLTFAALFTPRQLVALTTFSDLVQEAREEVRRDALAAGLSDDPSACSGQAPTPLRDGGSGATAYADAIGVYLSFVVSRCTDFNSTVCGWIPVVQATRNTFARQAIPMTWDYAELNLFGEWLANYNAALEKIIKPQELAFPQTSSTNKGSAVQANASSQELCVAKIVSTDPPYYDNIGYADLSDFFYVWLRRSLQNIYPDLFATLAVPKAEELVATPYRHGGKDQAETFFLNGMTKAMGRIADQADPGFPVTIYYAFKQSETESQTGTSSTGWETFLDAVLRAGFALSGTWPMRTELGNRMIGSGTNALASSIVLVCRRRATTATSVSRTEFVGALKAELPVAIAHLQEANIAPVDLAQASIGPGMAIFTRYAEVLEASGEPMTVRTALQLINQALDELMEAQEGWYDPETLFGVTWFSQYGFAAGPYGDADTIARARGTAPDAMLEFGFVRLGGGRFELLSRDELPADYDPAKDRRTAIWEATQYLCRALDDGGEDAAARLMRRFRETKPDLDIDRARELAYRLYAICDRKKWSAEARVYNALVSSWSDIETKSQGDGASWVAVDGTGQLELEV